MHDSYPSKAVVVTGLDLSLNGQDRESQPLNRTAVGTEPQTARFEVQILGEELKYPSSRPLTGDDIRILCEEL